MLGRYRGPLVLQEPAAHNPLHKRYPAYRNIYGQLLVDHKVTLEKELEEIRARHQARREYNRQSYAARKARLNPSSEETHAPVSDCSMDEPYA